MGVAPPPTRQDELAEFLRHLRERTSPEMLGIDAAGGRRRTPGLRREEVSQLAGVGLSWYTWLEQGRDITPSASVLDALALVFDLSGAERAHLYDLAGVPMPPPGAPDLTQAPPELAAWIAALDPFPAWLSNPRTDLLAANESAERVFRLPAPMEDGTRNLMWSLFTEPDLDGEMRDGTARTTLARFRAAHARHYDDPRYRSLIDSLLAASPRFVELWPRHEVLDSQHGEKLVVHRDLGSLRLRHLQLAPTAHPDLRITQFLPADEATRRTLVAARP